MNVYDEEWVCEAHPDKPFPHDDCPGPGMLSEETIARMEREVQQKSEEGK